MRLKLASDVHCSSTPAKISALSNGGICTLLLFMTQVESALSLSLNDHDTVQVLGLVPERVSRLVRIHFFLFIDFLVKQ